MNTKLQVSIIIPSYNSELYITRCLSALYSQNTDIGYEIIVVDSSNDSTSTLVPKKFPEVKLINLDQQAFPGAGRNIGAKEAKSDILAFIDSDCIARRDWINTIVEKINEDYVIIGGAIKNATVHSPVGTADYFMTFNEFLPNMPDREVTFLPTCNFICKKDVFEDIGGFPPDWLAGEDFLFCYEASKKYKLLFTRSIIISHINRENFKKFLFHHYNFGKHGAMTRKKLKLPGSAFTKHPLLASFLPIARFLRIFWRIIRWNRPLLPKFILTSPLIVVGVCAWGYGFLKKSFDF